MIVERKVVLVNKFGMHVRPAGQFVKLASEFDADIQVENSGNVVPGKSIMGLMTLEAPCGTELVLTAEGEDADEAIDALEALIGRKFDLADE